MWVHVLNDPAVAALVNERFVALRVSATDRGFPPFPAIDRFAREYAQNPWHHFFYGHFLVIDGTGSALLGGAGCQATEYMTRENPGARMRARLAVYCDRAARLRTARAAKKHAAIAAVRSEVEREIEAGYACLHDRRVVTVRALLHCWPDLRRSLTPPRPGAKDHLEAGVRDLAIEALGVLLTDDRPFDPRVANHLAVFSAALEPEDAMIVRHQATKGGLSAIRVPPGLRVRAVRCLADAFGWSTETVDEQFEARLVARWRTWRRQRAERSEATDRRKPKRADGRR